MYEHHWTAQKVLKAVFFPLLTAHDPKFECQCSCVNRCEGQSGLMTGAQNWAPRVHCSERVDFRDKFAFTHISCVRSVLKRGWEELLITTFSARLKTLFCPLLMMPQIELIKLMANSTNVPVNTTHVCAFCRQELACPRTTYEAYSTSGARYMLICHANLALFVLK